MTSGDPKFEIVTHTYKMLDTGIGIDAGYESDDAFRAAHAERMAALDPEVREAVEEVQRKVLRELLGGGS